MKRNLNEQNKNNNWLRKMVVCVMALIIGLTSLGLQVFAEGVNGNEGTEITSTPEPTLMPTEEPTAPDVPASSEETDANAPTPTNAPATDETTDTLPDTSLDTTTDDATGADGEESPVLPEETKEESKISASFESGVEEKEDGAYVWNVDPEEKEHTFAYRLDLKDVNSSTVKIMTPTTVFRDGEEGDFIASDLESDSSKLHLKVYEIQTAEDGTETKLEVKNKPREEAPADGVSAIAEANKEVAQEAAPPDISDIGGGAAEQEYSEHYVSQLAEESGILEIKSDGNTVINNSVLQIEYTVENGIYGNVVPQVFTSVLDVNESDSPEFKEYETNELEFTKNDEGKELEKNKVETVDKDDNAMKTVLSATGYYIAGPSSSYGTDNSSYDNASHYIYNKCIYAPGYSAENAKGWWGHNEHGWWFSYEQNGSWYYIINSWLVIKDSWSDKSTGECYFFDENGYMVENKFAFVPAHVEGGYGKYSEYAWCYFGPGGSMKTGWQNIAYKNEVAHWYYFVIDKEAVSNTMIAAGLNYHGPNSNYNFLPLTSANSNHTESGNQYPYYVDSFRLKVTHLYQKPGGGSEANVAYEKIPLTGLNSNGKMTGSTTITPKEKNIDEKAKYVYQGESPRKASVIIETSHKLNFTLNGSATNNLEMNYSPPNYGVWFFNQDGKDTQSENHEYGTVLNSIMYFNRVPWAIPTGYKFKGWFTSVTGGTQYTGNEKVTGDMKLYAQYTPVNYSITYNLNGGSISGQKTSYNIESADFTLPTPSKTGYTFTGWTGTGLSSPTQNVTISKGSVGNRSYTANWSINYYGVWFYNQDGKDTQSENHPYGTVLNSIMYFNRIPWSAPTGYKFKGWFTAPTGGTQYTGEEKLTKDVSLYAQYTPIAYTITYNLSGGSISGQKTSYNIETANFTLPTPVRNGYTFAGWTGTGLSSATKSVTVAKGSTGARSYTATWTKDTYTISYNLNGGSVTGNPTSYQVDTADITLKNPSKTGYSFAGWTGSNGTTAQTTVKIVKGSTGNKSYIANWTANTYTYNIKYVSKSGVSLGTSTVSGTYGSFKNATAPAKAGYSTPVAQKVVFDSVNAKTITFTYTPVDYTITYDVNGGNSLSGQRTTYTVESSAYTLPAPTRAGHTFTGWTGSNGTTAQTSVVLAKGTTGNKSYTANWKANTYTVTYNGNGATSGIMPTDTVTYGTNYTTRANGFTRPGYKFAGWTENADGTGSNWTNWIGKPWTWTYTRSITLYAQWTKDTYSISYNLNGGSISGNPTSYQVDTADITLKNPTKTGYTFTGWTGSNGNTPQTSVKIVKGSTGNKSYTANWSANTYTYNIKYVSKSGVSLGTSTVSGTYGSFKNATAPAKAGYSTPVAQKVVFDSVNAKTITFTYTPVDYSITYDLAGGSISGQKTSYNIESADFTLPAPTKTGYTFTGWTWNGNTTPQKSVTIKKGTTGNKSYTANWSTNSYTLTYNANGGTVTPASNNIKYGNPYILPTPSRIGYKFNGWFTSATGGTQVTTANKISGNTTVYAQWTPNKLKVNYYPNGATKLDNSISMDGTSIIEVDPNKINCTDVFNYDDKLPDYGLYNALRFIREGYTSTNLFHVNRPDSEALLDAGNNVYAKTQDLAKAAGVLSQLEKGDVAINVYPQWEANTYTNTIWHYAGGFVNGEGNSSAKKSFNLKKYEFNSKYNQNYILDSSQTTAVPNGFALERRVGTSSINGEWTYYKMPLPVTQKAEKMLFQYDYNPITYTITYNLNGGTLTKENPSTYNVLYGVDFTNEPTKEGYKFLGWYINGKKVTGINVGCNATFSSADDLYAKLATRTTGNQTVEAKWERLNDLTITNTVSGNMGSKAKDFTFTTQFPSSFANSTLKVQKNDGTITALKVDANGKCTFTLKHGESFTFKELTEAQYNAIKDLSNYGISESDYSAEGYKTSFKAKTDSNGNLQILFNNQNGTVLPTGIVLYGSGMGLIVALVIVLGWIIRKKFIN